MLLRIIWPVTHPDVAVGHLLEQARRDIPTLARQAHARIPRTGHRFYFANATDIPGSGRTTRVVLVCEIPGAVHTPRTWDQPAAPIDDPEQAA